MRLFLLVAVFTLPVLVFAGAGSLVQHSHGERSHSHPLPESGINHSHQKKGGKPIQQSDDSEWVKLPNKGSLTFSFNKTSYEVRKNKSGTDIGLIVLLILDEEDPKIIRLNKAYVTKKDCLAGHGKTVYTKLTGEFIFEWDFKENSSTVSSNIAKFVCQSFKKSEQEGKSL